jgi:hypothetical protein
MRVLAAVAVALAAGAGAPPAPARDAYYLVVFAAQNGELAVDRASHDFAAFVHMDRSLLAAPGRPAPGAVETVTISWLPARLPICVTCLEPVPGHNYGLRETLLIEERAGLRLSQWGPFEVDAELFAMAKAQREHLEAGGTSYIVWDRGWRPQALNCIHAVSDVDTTRPPLATGVALGDAAGWALVRYFMPRVRDRPGGGERLRRILGVDDVPVQQR